MALTEKQRTFAECLMNLMTDTEMMIGVALLVKRDKQISMMAKYLKENPKPTDEEILEEALRISKEESID